jgi:hypothetical protein
VLRRVTPATPHGNPGCLPLSNPTKCRKLGLALCASATRHVGWQRPLLRCRYRSPCTWRASLPVPGWERNEEGCGNKRNRKALLITYKPVKVERKAARSYAKQWRQASSLVSPFRAARVMQAKHGRRNIKMKMKQKSLRMLQITCSSSYLDLRLRLRRRYAARC